MYVLTLEEAAVKALPEYSTYSFMVSGPSN